MIARTFVLTAVLSVGTASLSAQDITVTLSQRTALDDETFHIAALRSVPKEKLTLPAVDTSGASYLEVYYSRAINDDAIVYALVLPRQDGQIFYIDLNNDEDLTNDGEPLFFPFDQNDLAFYFNSTSDSQQRTGRLLQRLPTFALTNSAAAASLLDENGNLKPMWFNFWQEHNPGMDGAKHTFFFDSYVDLSRGSVELDGIGYLIALYDYNQNGRFDNVEDWEQPDAADRFMIDLGQDGKLTSDVTTEMFKLNDVFEVAGKRYRLTNIDPYGGSVTIAETDAPLTNYYISAWESEREAEGAVTQGRVEDAFWNLTLQTTKGDVIEMRSLRGRHVLLNFWGEWCAPCLAEMPALQAVQEKRPAEELFIIGMLYTSDLEAALKLVSDRGLIWPQVIVTDTLAEQFKVNGYPTNILILPDGQRFVKAGQVSTAFFDRHME